MSRTISGARQTYLDTGVTTDAQFARIERVDGQVIGMTDHVEDVTLNSVVYRSSTGYTPTAVSSNIELRPGVVDLSGILDVFGVERDDVAAGVYDNARFYAFTTDYTNPIVDDQKDVAAFWGTIEIVEGRWEAELNSLADKLTQSTGRTFKPTCDTSLGSTRCGITLTPSAWADLTVYTERETSDAQTGSIIKPTTENGYFYHCTTAGTSGASEPVTWDTTPGGTTNDGTVVWTTIVAYTLTGSVTSVTSRLIFTDTTRTEADDWWLNGIITFNSGDNVGLSFHIKDSTSAGVLTLYEETPYTITITDTYTITVGCQKRHVDDCRDKFDNVLNFQGFPYIATQDEVFKFGGQ